MDPDDEVCLCFHVTLRKVRAFLKRENPPVASLISECLGAGTGCRWCVPILEKLHRQHARGQEPALGVSSSDYAEGRRVYRLTRERSEPPEENDPAGGVGG